MTASDSRDSQSDNQAAPGWSQRKVLLVDRAYQLGEVSRGIVVFLILALAQVGCFLIIGAMAKRGALGEAQAIVAVLGVSVLAPLALCALYIWLLVQGTHRVAGAAYRITMDIARMLDEPDVRFRLRKGDYLINVAYALNSVMERLQERSDKLAEAEGLLRKLQEQIRTGATDLPEATANALRQAVDALGTCIKQARAATPLPQE
jgi:hypothetical protein